MTNGAQVPFFRRVIDFLTLGSDRPIRRLVAYYLFLAAVVFLLFQIIPTADQLIKGDHARSLVSNSQLLQDGLNGSKDKAAEVPPETGIALALTALVVVLSTLALMLPVSWVFMSARRARDFNQSIVQTLIILPIVVAGIVLVVRTSLALAFSLGGIVAGLRFRTTMRDVRDTVYIFLGIGVGLAAGVQSLIVAAVLSVSFNFIVLLIWRYDFGRNSLSRPRPRSGPSRWRTWRRRRRTWRFPIVTWSWRFRRKKPTRSPSASTASGAFSVRPRRSRDSTPSS